MDGELVEPYFRMELFSSRQPFIITLDAIARIHVCRAAFKDEAQRRIGFQNSGPAGEDQLGEAFIVAVSLAFEFPGVGFGLEEPCSY